VRLWRWTIDNRQNYIHGFQYQVNPEWSRQEKEEYSVRFLIGMVETGGMGATFNMSHRIVLLEPYWTLKAQKQAFGPVDRIGNLNPISNPTVWRPKAESTMRSFCKREILAN
jgi:hypothetical protein